MKRHAFDALSFTFGVVFIALSIMLWFENFDLAEMQWLFAGGLLLLGASLLLSSRKRSRDER